jgi:hypothetical protein
MPRFESADVDRADPPRAPARSIGIRPFRDVHLAACGVRRTACLTIRPGDLNVCPIKGHASQVVQHQSRPDVMGWYIYLQ